MAHCKLNTTHSSAHCADCSETAHSDHTLYRCTGLKLQRNPGFVYTRGKHQSKRRADFEASRPRRLFCQVPSNPILDPKLLFAQHQQAQEANFGADFGSHPPKTAFFASANLWPNKSNYSCAGLDRAGMMIQTRMEICSTCTLFQFNFARSLSAAKMELLLGRRNA